MVAHRSHLFLDASSINTLRTDSSINSHALEYLVIVLECPMLLHEFRITLCTEGVPITFSIVMGPLVRASSVQ